MKKKFLLTMIAMVCGVSAWAFQIGDLKYEFNSDRTLEVVGLYTTELTNIIIPEKVDYNGGSFSVTSIGRWAFHNCSGLTSVILPNSIVNIGGGAFSGCSNLESVTIPNSIINIEEYPSLFQVCNKLQYNEFDNALYLGNTENPYVVLIKAKSTNITSCKVNGNCKIIFESAFKSCDALTSVEISNSVKSIGYNAFGDCSSLTTINIPNSVINIGGSAFNGCSGLISATIGSGVTSIGDYAFSECRGLTSIEIPNSVISIGEEAFSYCNSLMSATIGNGVINIGNYAFSECSGLTSIVIPNSVKSIGVSAFQGCAGFTSIFIGNGVTSIGQDAFSNFNDLPLTSIEIQSDVDLSKTGLRFTKNGIRYRLLNKNQVEIKSISCSDSGEVEIPETVTAFNNTFVVTGIGNSAFDFCSSLTSVVIPNTVTSIGTSAFAYCDNLVSVVIPNSVTSIGRDAFMFCGSLTSVVIPNSVTDVGNRAFYGCDNLQYKEYDNAMYLGNNENPYHVLIKAKTADITSCEINSNCKVIAPYAFSGRHSLTSIIIPNSVTNVCEGAFSCSGLTSVTIGDSVTSIGKEAFSECSSLTSITIPNSVKNIGYGAFEHCPSLESITLPFVGDKEYSANDENPMPFGYIFGHFRMTESDTDYIEISQIRADYTIPSALKEVTVTGSSHIPYGAFQNCKYLTSVTLADSVISIGDYAFANCYGLISVNIPDSVTIIGHAFAGCSSLTSISIPSSVKSIGAWAFSNCNNLQIAEFASVESMCGIKYEGPEANPLSHSAHLYMYGKEVTNLIVPESVTSIPDYAFFSCKSLNSVTIPNTVTSIGWGAFDGCSNLNSALIGDSIKTIGEYAFRYCGNLISVAIPSSVISVGDYAFANCYRLLEINVSNDNTVYASEDGVLYNKNKTTLISYPGGKNGLYIIPDSVTTICSSAFYEGSGLISVAIPNSVKNISWGAFDYCNATLYCECEEALKPANWNSSWNIGIILVNWGCKVIRTMAVNNGIVIAEGTNYAFKGNKGSLWYLNEEEMGTVTLTATANEGYHFLKWEDDVDAGRTRVENVTESKTYIATFDAHIDSVVFENIVAATCTKTGSRDSVVCCSVCKMELSRNHVTIPATGHTINTDSGVAATCTDFGLTEGKHCSVCNAVLVAQDTIAALGHTEVVDTSVAATCTEIGLTEGKHCSVCNIVLVVQDTIPTLGHTVVVDSAVAATATEIGLTEGSHCSVCGLIIVAQDTIPALGVPGENQGTAVEENVASVINIYANGNTIVVENAIDEIFVYNAMGALVGRDAIHRVRAEIIVNNSGVYIVKTGNKTQKVVMP